MRVLVTGGTGFIGKPLISHLQALGHETWVLTRDLAKAKRTFPSSTKAFLYGQQGTIPSEALENVEAIVHLAGENVGEGRWTKKRKEKIFNSRINSTRALVSAIARLLVPPKIFISASAIGFYGDTGNSMVTESSPRGNGFLAEVVEAWEKEIFAAESLGLRVVALRNGVVLGDGGALAKMLFPFQFGLGAILGNGQQYMSGLHLEDAIGLILFALKNKEVKGVVNACTPSPLTNKEFSIELAKILKRPLFLRLPTFILKIIFGEMSAILIDSQRVSSEKVARLGYHFHYPKLEDALKQILGK